MTRTRMLALGLAMAALLACDRDSDPPPGDGTVGGAPVVLKCAVARTVAGAADLVPGPIARGTVGDVVIENDKLRAIVQKGGRNWYNISQFGGNIIDALPKAADGALIGNDNFEEFVLGTNIESVPNYQSVTVAEAGGENPDGSCKRAVVRATAEFDDLMDFVNGSSAIRGQKLGGVALNFPRSADDVDLPFTFETTYTLEAGARFVTVATTISNPTPDTYPIYLVEYMNGSGEVELFQHGYGFGEPFATAPCAKERCDYAAYAGHEGGAGVSYGLIHKEEGTSSVSVSGVTVFLYGLDVVSVALTPEDTQASNPDSAPNYDVPGNGSLTFTRYFAVGDGTVSSIVDVRNTIHALATGTVTGRVIETGTGAPVANAEIAMWSSQRDGFPSEHGPVINIVNHTRTGPDGRYTFTYPPGSYTLEVNVPGRLAPTPASQSITIAAAATTTVGDFVVPKQGYLRVRVQDAAGQPLPAKVQLVGARLGPDGNEPRNKDCIGNPANNCALGQNPLKVTTGMFGDPKADPLPPGVALAEFSVLDTGSGTVTIGDTGDLPIDAGTYALWVSHGPRYATYTEANVSVGEGVTSRTVTLAEVMPTPGYVYGDFHVHSINSPDSEVTNRERVATYLAEDMDFFTPSDHDIRVDFSPVVAAMGVGGRIATAPSAEVTTFDYGHFNFWPVAIETDKPCDDFAALVPFGKPCGHSDSGHSQDAKIGRGATDWGGQAPLGKDFPTTLGNEHFYSRSPAEILAAAAQDPFAASRAVVRQINHIDSHFGNIDGGGLSIDTGADPITSGVDPADRRLDPALAGDLYSNNYDALEVWIGTDGVDYQDNKLYAQNLGDWFNLLNQGKRKTAVSDSDTHSRVETSLHTRNQISVPAGLLSPAGRASFAAIAADPHGVGDSMIAGLTTMTNAPFLEVSVKDPGTSPTNVATLKSGRAFGGVGNPLPSDGSAVEVLVTVRSPPWAPYNQILVYTNGETERHVDQFGQATEPPRYRICGPGTTNTYTLDATTNGFTRAVNAAGAFETSLTATVNHAGGDFWVVVMARGTSGVSKTMWPVVPNSHAAGPDGVDGTADDVGIRALAISNPVYVDVGANGWTAPGVANTVHAGSTLPPDGCAQDMPAP